VTAAGYPDLLFHDLRRSAVRNMRKAGMDQKMRMQISGHKTDSMEKRYNILVADDVKESTKLMDGWFQKQRQKPRGERTKERRSLLAGADSYRPMRLRKLQISDSKLEKATFTEWPFSS
jgi:hypothetical protein